MVIALLNEASMAGLQTLTSLLILWWSSWSFEGLLMKTLCGTTPTVLSAFKDFGGGFGFLYFLKPHGFCGKCCTFFIEGERSCASSSFLNGSTSSLCLMPGLKCNLIPVMFFSKPGDVLILETDTFSFRNSSLKFSSSCKRFVIIIIY
ncbi:unnamed protein product [Moneuplotes crassus]|uniref:Uncharacterized protein n=1 Tax=Euplotes crassus TaxID=5936 RepID=A0AAD1X8Q4_EUPCR|nr:unnamed protein product [Moneuplotes crassus]